MKNIKNAKFNYDCIVMEYAKFGNIRQFQQNFIKICVYCSYRCWNQKFLYKLCVESKEYQEILISFINKILKYNNYIISIELINITGLSIKLLNGIKKYYSNE